MRQVVWSDGLKYLFNLYDVICCEHMNQCPVKNLHHNTNMDEHGESHNYDVY